MTYEQASEPALIIEHTGQVFHLTSGMVTIGTEEDNTIILADPKVSAHHARIFWEAETRVYVIEDLGSVEGTYVNEYPIPGAQVLADGDVIRIGDTVIDVDLAPPVPAAAGGEVRSRSPLLAGILVVLLAGITLVCAATAGILLLNRDRDVPDVILRSPGTGEQIIAGTPILLQATASGVSDITLLELSVDNLVVATATSESSNGTSLLTISQTWVFETPGEHEIVATAYTARGQVSSPTDDDSRAVVIVVTAESTPTPIAPTETPLPTDTPEPPTSTPPPPTPAQPPQIAFFQANPATIDAGDCTTLEWGLVTSAIEVHIEPGIGGVVTPGSRSICPGETTTFILTARGPGGIATASTTVEVRTRLADLVVESIAFDPSTPVQGRDTQVRITIRNAGSAASGPFAWEWLAGSDAVFDGRIPDLQPGDITVVTPVWTPANAYASLLTEARVDPTGEVPEENEENNRLTATVQVVPGATEPEIAILVSEQALDGYVLNDGSTSTTEGIFVGNGEINAGAGELVSRGFMSFDLSTLPSDAKIEQIEVRFFQVEVEGDPYETMGNLILDHVEYGNALTGSAFDAPALDSAMLAQQTRQNEWYVLSDPTFISWLQRDLRDGRSRFQFRLRFARELDGDGEEDWIAIATSDGSLGPRSAPQVIVTFRR
ncbi:MAG: FHA domain-containing protein [Anaerolineae bacterium]|jgi:hypothetical protein